MERRPGAAQAQRGPFGGLPHVRIEVQAGARSGVQGAVRGAGEAGLRAEAAAGQAGRRAGQTGWDGGWRYGVSHGVVEWLGAHGEACGTLFHTALLIEVVAGIALCNKENPTAAHESEFLIQTQLPRIESLCPRAQ